VKKENFFPLLVIVGLLFAWAWIDRTFVKPRFPDPVPPPAESLAVEPAVPPPAAGETPALRPAAAVPAPAPVVAEPVVPAVTHILSNAVVRVRVSNRGGTVEEAFFPGYRQTQAPDSPHVVFDFQSRPSLGFAGLPGLEAHDTLEVVSASETNVVFRRVSPQGVAFQRTLTMDPRNYVLRGVDTFRNTSGSDVVLPGHLWQLGPMERLDNSDTLYPTTGVDAHHTGGVGVKHYAQAIHKMLDRAPAPTAVFGVSGGFDWITVKNRFFCQLLTVHEGELPLPEGASVPAESARVDDAVVTQRVAAEVRLPGARLLPDVEYRREYTLFLGPTKPVNLSALGGGQDGTVDYHLWRIFSFVEHICGWLTSALNGIHAVIPNYGVAIILLTFLVRMALWPLTHKSSVSMRKMQALQPQMQAIKEKYSEPSQRQKQQQAMMALFKENKVNPAAGCLPILVQIPVFIGLYGALNTAVELRFAEFLWVRDLSLPEGLLAGQIPLLGELNILPVIMAITMYIQQRMTPSTMDPAQQRIMNFMPIMVGFFCYKMPSGLSLYWTTSNLISIAQLIINVKWLKMHPLPVAAPAPAPGKSKSGKR
jgi:YidC/Oxa1 family membrane protein insertase